MVRRGRRKGRVSGVSVGRAYMKGGEGGGDGCDDCYDDIMAWDRKEHLWALYTLLGLWRFYVLDEFMFLLCCFLPILFRDRTVFGGPQ